jgi:hypothetical protein
MKKYLLMIGKVLGAMVFLFMFTSYDKKDNSSNDKVTICHIPPGNPGNAHEIVVSANAVPAHLAHGDYLGSCSNDEE